VKCGELIGAGVSRKISKLAELEVGKFEVKSQTCPDSENEETELSVKPCKKRARSPDTQTSNKRIKRENVSAQVSTATRVIEIKSPSKYWFSLTNKPSKIIYIPINSTNQTINEFFIQENLIDEYDSSNVELKPDGYRAELVSMETNILELHSNIYTIVWDFCAFGEYECDDCGRGWKSAQSYLADGMKCQNRGCSDDLVYAHKRTVKGGPSSGEGGGEHREDLCGRCRRLGHRCGNRFRDNLF
jgi:hypothetical protein